MAASAYDAIAEWYDAWLGDGSLDQDPLFAAVTEQLGSVAGARVCDLGCGQGRVARRLAAQGARVVGVDLSAKLLAIAARRQAAETCAADYVRADAQTLACLADGAFDGVLCYMALMDIPDLEATVRSVARVLRPSGWFVFSVLHPCYNPPASGELQTSEGWVRTVAGYLDEGFWRSANRTGPPGRVGSYHRTLGTYVNALLAGGFALERIDEPRAGGRLAETRPVWVQVPAYLVVRCRRVRHAATPGSAG